MDKVNTLELLSQALHHILPCIDKRAKIQTQDFITALVFCCFGDSKIFSIESMRRRMKALLQIDIPRSSFWERLATKSLTKHLQNVLAYIMGAVELPCFRGQTLLKALNVSSIQLIDSSSVSLWDGLKEKLPGTRTTAGIKWHACFDLLTGMLTWFDFSSTSSHDRKHFPDIESLRGVLMIFDLGYFDYGLMKMIEDAQGFFLCRLKSNSKIRVHLAIEGIGMNQAGQLIQNIRSRATVIDFMGIFICQKYGLIEKRVVGFYNSQEKTYHWYLTNLQTDAKLIYPLYRLRWQIEMIFKSCKSSLNLGEIPTGNVTIVLNLMLTSILSYLVSLLTLEVAKDELSKEEAEAITPQRIVKVLVHISSELFEYLFYHNLKYYERLKDKIRLFARELFDPNFRSRPTGLQAALALC